MRKIKLPDLVKKYNVNYYRIRQWILKGWVVGGKERMKYVLLKKGMKNPIIIEADGWWVDEDSFLAVPEAIRKATKPRKKLEGIKK